MFLAIKSSQFYLSTIRQFKIMVKYFQNWIR